MFFVDASDGNDANDGFAQDRAWQSLAKVNEAALRPGDTVLFKRGGTWRGQLLPKSGDGSAPLTYTAYGAGEKPLLFGSVSRNFAEDWVHEGGNIWRTKMLDSMDRNAIKDLDVGNIIFDHGKTTGVKKWKPEELQRPYDFWYDADNRLVKLFSRGNPADVHPDIELALKRNIVQLKDVHNAVFDGLAMRYGAAHGFGGGNTHNLVIRNCDISYIGGGNQYSRFDGQRGVRFGNGIEFGGGAYNNLVEGCRIWEIYDAALTNQSNSPDLKQENITYRNNVIWNAEYSFEYWNRPESAVTENIRFINNTCVNAGGGWAHSQRPGPNGSHLMFYSNTAATKGVEVKYNIFYNATDWGLLLENDRRGSLDLDYNLWYQYQGIIAKFLKTNLPAADVAGYRKQTGFDEHSLFADPKFVAPAVSDFRLAPDSPARSLRPDGGPVGALALF